MWPVRVSFSLNFAMPLQAREGDGIINQTIPIAGRAIPAKLEQNGRRA